jgi:hypothetical protein
MNTELSQPGKDPRSRRVMVRFSETEFQDLMKLVEDLGATRSKLFRKLIREALGSELELVGHHMKTIGEGIYQLGALGRNLNQQLRLVHSGQVVGQPLDVVLLQQVKEELLNLEEEWLLVIQRSKDRGVGHA